MTRSTKHAIYSRDGLMRQVVCTPYTVSGLPVDRIPVRRKRYITRALVQEHGATPQSRAARRRRAAVHDAGADDDRRGHRLDEGAAEALLRRGRADDTPGERRVGRRAVRGGRPALRLHELQAALVGLHAGRAAGRVARTQ